MQCLVALAMSASPPPRCLEATSGRHSLRHRVCGKPLTCRQGESTHPPLLKRRINVRSLIRLPRQPPSPIPPSRPSLMPPMSDHGPVSCPPRLGVSLISPYFLCRVVPCSSSPPISSCRRCPYYLAVPASPRNV
jgi:hypothetical protein